MIGEIRLLNECGYDTAGASMSRTFFPEATPACWNKVCLDSIFVSLYSLVPERLGFRVRLVSAKRTSTIECSPAKLHFSMVVEKILSRLSDGEIERGAKEKSQRGLCPRGEVVVASGCLFPQDCNLPCMIRVMIRNAVKHPSICDGVAPSMKGAADLLCK